MAEFKQGTSNSASIVGSLTDAINARNFNMSGMTMESFGGVNDVSAPLMKNIKNVIRELGLARHNGFGSKRVRRGEHLGRRTNWHMESTVDPLSPEDDEVGITEDTQNEEVLLTEAQEKAGVAAAVMAEDPVDWAKKSADAANVALASAETSDVTYVSDRISMESYDASNFKDAIGFSVIWNVVAARQSDAVENMWPTITLDPDASHLEASAQFQVFMQELKHKNTGIVGDLGRKPLIEAVVDGAMLDENITKCVPCVIKGVNEDFFVDPAKIAPHSVTVEGETVLTAPLRPGQQLDLIGLSQSAVANLSGEMGMAAQLAVMPRMETLYYEITNADGATSIIKLDATRLPRSTFVAPPEGYNREIMLNMQVEGLGLDGNTLDISGKPAEALAFLREPTYKDNRVEFAIRLNGTGDLQYGNIEVDAGSTRVTSVRRKQGYGGYSAESDKDVVSTLTGKIKSIKLLAFSVDAKYTNLDRRQRGPLTNIVRVFEKYFVYPGSPISTFFPAVDAKTEVDLVAPMTATRMKNDYLAIKELFHAADSIAAVAISDDADMPRIPLKAIGRYIIRPHYQHITISALDVVDSTRSKHKLEDLQHALINTIRDSIIHAIRDSRYQIALRVQTGSPDAAPVFAGLTNPILEKYLNGLGDSRILGNLGYDIMFGSHDSKLLGGLHSDEHELFIVPRLTTGHEMNPLNFGNHLWKPEQASTMQITRDNSTSREIIVQPTNSWQMTCPFIIRITVKDISHVMKSKTPLLVNV